MSALARGIQLLLGIGRVRASQEKSMVGTLQVQLNAMETVDGLVNSSHYGFHSRPHAGCDAVVAFVGGDRSKGDGVGLCMLTKRLEHGQFVWPSAASAGRIALSPPQLAALLDGCEWRAPAPVRRPELAG